MPIGSSLIGGAGGNLGTLYLNMVANPTKLIAGMKAAEAAVVKSSAGMVKAMSVAALGITGAAAAIGLAGVVQFGQFEKAMTKSTAIMGDVSKGLRNEMELTARVIATNSVTSAEELAEAYFFLASAGLTAKQSIAALNTVNMFAIAGQFDMAKATDLLTDAQSALGLVVKDTAQNMANMTRISDVLVKANTLANATVEQFSSSLTREAGAAMKSFTIDVEEGVAVLAAFADQGVKGEIAGTSFSRILRLMTSAAVKNADAYRTMGIEVFDTSGNLNNMADIIADLEVALGDLSDEQRVVALDTLGFQARVQGVILPLLGTSDAIREYERNLRLAGGTTQDVADKQMKSFFDQLTITWNRIKDILLTVGEQLTPVLRIFNSVLQDLVGTSGELNDANSAWVVAIAPAFITGIGLIGDAIHGWNLLIKALQLGFAKLTEAAAKDMASLLNTIINVMTKAVKAFAKFQDFALSIPGAEVVLGEGLDTDALLAGYEKLRKDITVVSDTMVDVTAQVQKELDDLVAKGTFSERLQKKFDDATGGAKSSARDIIGAVEMMKDKVSAAWGEMGEFVAGSDFFKKAVSDLDRVSVSVATQDIDKRHSEAFGVDGQGGTFTPLAFGQDPASFQLEQFEDQRKLAEEHLNAMSLIEEQGVELTQKTLDKKIEIQEAYEEQLRALKIAEAQIIIGSAEGMFGDLAGIAEDFAGKQSGVYKGMFAASKAFAIANATIQIATGLANAAAAQPWFLAIPAIASVVAATAGIISSIQSVQMEFGGARALGGPVQTGKSFLVGENGPELFTPPQNGNITPNNRLMGGGGGGTNVEVIVNNFSDATATVTETQTDDGRKVEIIIAKTKNSIAGDIKNGTGAVNSSMQSAFGLKRSGK